MSRLVRLWCLLSLVMCMVAWFKRNDLPDAASILPNVHHEPIQTALIEKPFEVLVDQKKYSVEPLYEYDLYGVVVSFHDTSAWNSFEHRQWGDQLNVLDMCVIWGKNVEDVYAVLHKIEFWNQQYTCFFQTSDDAAYHAFDQTAISNNHLITDSASLAKQIRQLHVGDQIHMQGKLANYQHGDFSRKTSTVRTDTGDGACEIVWVNQFEIVLKNPKPWRMIFYVSLVSLIVGIVMLLRMPLTFNR